MTEKAEQGENGSRILRDAVDGALDAAKVTQERLRQMEMQLRAAYMQRREALAGIVLNGICAGVYSQPENMRAGWGDRAVDDAVNFADQLMQRLAKPPAAAANE